MKLYLLLEIVRGNEGVPGVWLFHSRSKRDKAAAKLRQDNDDASESENPDENSDVLIIRQTVEAR